MIWRFDVKTKQQVEDSVKVDLVFWFVVTAIVIVFIGSILCCQEISRTVAKEKGYLEMETVLPITEEK